MTDDMLHRIGKAICRREIMWEHPNADNIEALVETNWYTNGEIYVDYARAALGEMREPTEIMRLAVNHAAIITPMDVWGNGCTGEYVWLIGLAAGLGVPDVLEKAEDERAKERRFEEQYPGTGITGTTRGTKTGDNLRAIIDAALKG